MPQDSKIKARDISVFSILTAMSSGDRRSFLDIQNIIRDSDRHYTYLEVGSDLGGSLIAPLIDSRCQAAISIDSRTTSSPDERAQRIEFPGNSTKRMIETLQAAGLTRDDLAKLKTFDLESSAVTLAAIGDRCRFAFIDAEHTNIAVFRDFLSVRQLILEDSVVVFHDANLIFDGLLNIEEMLRHEGAVFAPLYLPDQLFVLGFGALATEIVRACAGQALDREKFIAQSQLALNAEIARNTLDFKRTVDKLAADARELRRVADEEHLQACKAGAEARTADMQAERARADAKDALMEAENARAEADAARAHANAVLTSTTWRATAAVRVPLSGLPPGMRRQMRRFAKAAWWAMTPWSMPARLAWIKERRRQHDRPQVQAQLYERWIREYDTLNDSDRSAIGAHIAALESRPLISVLMPVYNTPERYLREAIDSVLRQLYPYWELCIADDASTRAHVRTVLEDYRRLDPRVKVVYRRENGHISAASNSALEIAAGEFVALLDHDDLLPEHALYEIAVEINACPEADVVYSDSDNVDDNGRRWAPYFKTDWNPDLMCGHNMVSHLGVYRRTLVATIGGLRVGFEGSQDYDLMLRAAEASTPDRIRHVSAILYHWRRNASSPAFSETSLERCVAAARRAIAEHFVRTGTPVRVEPAPKVPQWTRVVYLLPSPPPSVSIIVPTRDRHDFLRRCADGILNNTNYPQLELLIVDNDSKEPETHRVLEQLSQDPRVRVIRQPGVFNFAAISNRAVAEAHGEIIVLMNNDVEVISPSWLEEMVSHALRPEVGAVGAKLLYPDGRVQHAGVVLGVGHGAGHFFHLSSRADVGYFGFLSLTRRVSAVTAACMAFRRSVFVEVGGFDEASLPVAFNDVDLCLRIGERGYAIVWTPHAELYHHESVSRGHDLDDDKRRARFERDANCLRRRWRALLDRDPYYNQSCSTAGAHFELGFPPRRRRPWRHIKERTDIHAAAAGNATGADQLLAPINRSAPIVGVGPRHSPIAPKAGG